MPETLSESGERVRAAISGLTRRALDKAIAESGKSAKVGFPGTSYYLPLVNSLLNIKVKNLGDLAIALEETGKPGLSQGLALLLCEEMLAVLAGGAGFIPDKLLRSLGLKLVDGRISGVAVILGPAKDDDSALTLVRDFKSKGVISLLAGNTNGRTLESQLKDKGVETGLENYILPLGCDYLSAVYAVNFAARMALSYGGFKPGQRQEIINYIRGHFPAFVLLLGYADEAVVATGLGAMVFGFPIISDLELPLINKREAGLFDTLVIEKDYKKIPSRCIFTRGIKVRPSKPTLPFAYSAAFEGERVRGEELQAEFGGKPGLSFELLISREEREVEDGNIELIGPDIGQLGEGSGPWPLAIVVDVYGRKMQKDIEPVLERQIHRFINYAMGLMHLGQRDMNSIRVSRDAFIKGFRLKHIGAILHSMLHQEYGAIVDKAQVKLYTGKEDVERLLVLAKEVFAGRDERLRTMTDESVDTYYSCLICQSSAPNHVCVVTPERPGLCGAYSWLDAKASFEIVPTGPNQPILKGEALDKRLGEWESVNKFVEDKSNRTINRVSIYSLMDNPHSSCGFFECIAAVIPEARGVMVVNRDYCGMTPLGMDFAALANSAGGGIQVPGFLGIGKLYVLSRKFISAEGGVRRLVWMPRGLKELLGERLRNIVRDIGEPDLLEQIADEEVATTVEELLGFLSRVKHPALSMGPLI